MAIYSNKEVTFSGIRQPQLLTGGKIGVGKYEIDESGNIIAKLPIINAIDIDWNNASLEGLDTIESTEDLLNLIKNIKVSVPKNINDLQGSNDLLTQEDIQALKPQLTGKSAYELAKESYEESTQSVFPYQTVASWVASLKGENGPRGFTGQNGKDGKSAYDIAQEYYQSIGQEFPYSNQTEWIQQVMSGNDTKEYTDTEIANLYNRLSVAIQNVTTTIKETDEEHLEVKLIETENRIVNDQGETVITYKAPYKYQISLKDVASKIELDNLKTTVDTLATTDLVNQIDQRINNIIGGASEAYDTLKEIEDWINESPMSPTEILNSIALINENIDNLTGELKEEKAIDDGHGNITYIEDYKVYDKTGEQYAKSLEEVNEKINNLLNNVSIAKDVQDGAQENLIEYITSRDQTFNINNEDILNHFIEVEKPENSKTVLLSINQNLLSDLQNNIINKSVDQSIIRSKEYIDKKLSWEVE